MEEQILEVNNCEHCNSPVGKDQTFCENCGYPQNGDDSDKAKFHANRVLSNSKSKEAPHLIRKARNTLFVISGITFLFGLFFMLGQDDTASFIASSVLAIVYLVLGFWSQKKPLIALMLALFVYLTTIVINGVLLPESIFKGIFIKILIIVFLVKGINSALHLRKTNN